MADSAVTAIGKFSPLAFYLFCAAIFVGNPAAAEEPELPSKGQTVYVPVYSEIRYGNIGPSGQTDKAPMSVLVSIRNTDPKASLRVIRAPYYDTHGRVLGNYVPQPINVGPFGTAEVFVELRESAGGSGANFAIEWDAEKPISPPIIEALHSRFYAGYSVSFISRGKVISAK